MHTPKGTSACNRTPIEKIGYVFPDKTMSFMDYCGKSGIAGFSGTGQTPTPPRPVKEKCGAGFSSRIRKTFQTRFAGAVKREMKIVQEKSGAGMNLHPVKVVTSTMSFTLPLSSA